MNGTIKVKNDRGFGFITPDGEGEKKDLFFHSTALIDGLTFDQLKEGDRVAFEVDESGPKGPAAKNVKLAA